MRLRPRPLRPARATRPTSDGGDGRPAADGGGSGREHGRGGSVQATLDAISGQMGADKSFDLVVRRLRVAGREAAFIYLDGFLQPVPAMRVLQSLMGAREAEEPGRLRRRLEESLVPFFELAWVRQPDEAVHQILAGQAATVVAGIDDILLLDLRQYPSRAVAEPDLERVTRGAREGFTEVGLTNVNLVRRRLRDPHLRVEALKVGLRSRTDVFLLYVEGLSPPDLVDSVRSRLVKIRADALPMGSKNLEEYLAGTRLNPFPLVRYTERPDVAASHLLEGYLVVITDTSPAAMVLPANVWQFTQHAEEYVQAPTVGTYLRWVRFAAIVMSVALVPVWVALATHRESLPAWLEWVGPKRSSVFPIWLQLLLLTLGLDVIRMALIHTPTALATSIGLVGAVLLGQFAVSAGLFTNEALLYGALAAIGSFTTPALEFALALRLFQYPLIGLGAWLGLPGVAVGLAVLLSMMALTRSFSLPYLWPLLPFHGSALARLLFRQPIPSVRRHRAPTTVGEATPDPS